MDTYMMKWKNVCESWAAFPNKGHTPNASHFTGSEVKRLHCEQHNWGMTAANTLSTSRRVIHTHTDTYTLSSTHTHTKDTFKQSWQRLVQIETHMILRDHLLMFFQFSFQAAKTNSS